MKRLMQQLKVLKIMLLYVCIALMACLSLPADAQQKGKATFYSRRANGARSASGERIHSDSLVCAHRTHPFGTLLKVRNPANGKEVVVRVIDRGPFARGRVIDLSLRAARELGIVSQGVAMVEVSVYKRKVEVPYKPDDDLDLPELDMEVTEPDLGTSPQWQQNAHNAKDAIGQQQTAAKAEHGHAKAETTTAKPGSTAGKTEKTAAQTGKTAGKAAKPSPRTTKATHRTTTVR